MKTYNPQIKVVLRKTIRTRSGVADRFEGKAAEIDLSPYLGEGSVVTTQKGINRPAGGFTIQVGDRLYPAQRQVEGAVDALYALVEPMDVIEIRMQRTPGSGVMPLVMRGLVSSVEADETVSGDGRPSRTVTITGQDWGKWLQIIQIKYLRGQPIADTLDQLTGTLLTQRFGIAYISMSAGEFITNIIGKVINPFIEQLDSAGAGSRMPSFALDVSGADAIDKVFPQGYQANPQGTIWSYVQTFGNLGPFYELLIDEEEEQPMLVYRKPPFVALDGTKIFSESPDVDVYQLSPQDLIRGRTRRSDANVANWFFVQAPRSQFLSALDVVLQSLSSKTDVISAADHPNCARKLFGPRLMEVETQHGTLRVPGDKEDEVHRQDTDLAGYLEAQIKHLRDSNVDNVMLEEGTLTLRGDETMRPGRYFEMDRRGLLWRGYITDVNQTFRPFAGFTTELSFCRGTGFVKRSLREASGREQPYRAHIGKGVYEG